MLRLERFTHLRRPTWVALEADAMYLDNARVAQDWNELIRILQQAADEGEPEAQYCLGRIYCNDEAALDAVQSAHWYRKAAEQGHRQSQYELAELLIYGPSEVEDRTAGRQCLREVAEAGFADAQYELGDIYSSSFEHEETNRIYAVLWYRKAAEQGHARACLRLGMIYQNDSGVEQNIEEAISWYRKAFEHGQTYAASILGTIYDLGERVPQSFAEAARWYGKVPRGPGIKLDWETRSLCRLGEMYESGLGVEQSDRKAIQLYCEAAGANSGSAKAALILGHSYATGGLKRQQEDEYVHWIVAAAEEGDENAACVLGCMYARRELATCGVTRAYSWLRKAAEQGDPDAQHDLGVVCQQGQYDSQDYSEAFRWYSLAAEQGHNKAQHRLALLYELGRGAVQNYTQAYMWSNLAASQATKDCEKAFVKARDRIAAKATPGQMAQGQRLASSWKPKKWRAPKS